MQSQTWLARAVLVQLSTVVTDAQLSCVCVHLAFGSRLIVHRGSRGCGLGGPEHKGIIYGHLLLGSHDEVRECMDGYLRGKDQMIRL